MENKIFLKGDERNFSLANALEKFFPRVVVLLSGGFPWKIIDAETTFLYFSVIQPLWASKGRPQCFQKKVRKKGVHVLFMQWYYQDKRKTESNDVFSSLFNVERLWEDLVPYFVDMYFGLNRRRTNNSLLHPQRHILPEAS